MVIIDISLCTVGRTVLLMPHIPEYENILGVLQQSIVINNQNREKQKALELASSSGALIYFDF
jgi:hypothetical protein